MIRAYVMLKRKPHWSGHGRKGAKRRKVGFAGTHSGFARPSGRGTAIYRPSISTWNRPGQQADCLQVKLRSYLSVAITSTTGAVVNGGVLANDLKQPFQTFVGASTHQGAFATAVEGLWERYTVVAARLEAIFYTASGGTGVPMAGGMVAEYFHNGSSTTQTATFTALLESARAKYGVFPTTVNAGALARQGLKQYCSLASAAGVPAATVRADPNFSAPCNVSGNYGTPANKMYFSMVFQSADAASTATCGCDLILTQYVLFQGRRAGY